MPVLSPRVKFMIETILDLKNNRKRLVNRSEDLVHFESVLDRLRQNDGTLSAADSILRISWNQLTTHSKGRWWLVGSAFAEIDNLRGRSAGQGSHESLAANDPTIARILKLAQKQKMNTDIRRSLFCTMMSSEDYLDCFIKIMNMNLKGKQDRDVIHVLLCCCLLEKSYNKYYELLGTKLCSFNHNYKFTLQYAFWDKFRAISSLSESKQANLSLLIAGLIKSFALSLAILKSVEFEKLSAEESRFFQQFLAHLLLASSQDDLSTIFQRIAKESSYFNLCQGLLFFIKQFRQQIKSSPSQFRSLISDLPAFLISLRFCRKQLEKSSAAL